MTYFHEKAKLRQFAKFIAFEILALYVIRDFSSIHQLALNTYYCRHHWLHRLFLVRVEDIYYRKDRLMEKGEGKREQRLPCNGLLLLLLLLLLRSLLLLGYFD